MQSKSAFDLTMEWSKAREDQQAAAQALLSALRAELTSFLPDAVDTSVAVLGDVPKIIAVDDVVLLTIPVGQRGTAADRVSRRFNRIGRWQTPRYSGLSRPHLNEAPANGALKWLWKETARRMPTPC